MLGSRRGRRVFDFCRNSIEINPRRLSALQCAVGDCRRAVCRLSSDVVFAHDSPVERDGFELPVPQQIRSHFRASSPVSHDRVDGLATRNRRFESVSLQRRVRCEPDFLSRVDHVGEVLDVLVQRRRDDSRAALRLMRKLLKEQGFAPTCADAVRDLPLSKTPE
jgi:hypothetical protein